MRIEVFFAGIGGQGIRLMGEILGKYVVEKLGLYASLITRYTPEVRGGPIHVELVISDEPIDYPRTKSPDISIFLHDKPFLVDPEVEEVMQAVVREMKKARKRGNKYIVADAQLAVHAPGVHIKISEEAEKIGRRALNMVALGIALRLLKDKFGLDIDPHAILETLKEMKKYSDENAKAILRGFELASQAEEA